MSDSPNNDYDLDIIACPVHRIFSRDKQYIRVVIREIEFIILELCKSDLYFYF